MDETSCRDVADATAALSESERRSLLSFLGFGNPAAPFVFIGMEEGLTETPDYPLLAQLKDRAKLPPIADLRASGVHPKKYLTGSHPPIQSTWSCLIRVLLALGGNTTPTNDTIRLYQRDILGSFTGESALLEFLPLPARSVANWAPYDSYFRDYPDRRSYFNALKGARAAVIREHLAYMPRLVVLYGSAYWSQYRALFPLVERWESRDLFEHGRSGSTSILLMPHPVSRQMNRNRGALCDLALDLVGNRT